MTLVFKGSMAPLTGEMRLKQQHGLPPDAMYTIQHSVKDGGVKRPIKVSANSEGSFGAVFSARQKKVGEEGRQICVKVINRGSHPRFSANEMTEMLQKEVEIQYRVRAEERTNLVESELSLSLSLFAPN
jgi:hypothetical protein